MNDVVSSIAAAGVLFQLVHTDDGVEIHLSPLCRSAELVTSVCAYLSSRKIAARKRKGWIIQLRLARKARKSKARLEEDDEEESGLVE